MPDIKNLPVNCLYQHPDNPRKNLGDLTELAASIKTNGILQNLTVIPAMQVPAVWTEICKEEPVPQEAYVVIIGHRRLAAAKDAGLTEVPCNITSLTPMEQVQEMLHENLLRQKLTTYEEVKGFQMMLDLGATVDTLVKTSGFSETTVRSRVKLLRLDDKAFQDATEKQITLETLSEVAKIENAKKRNEILAKYGTNNFQWDLQQTINRQAARKNKPAAKKEILAYATEVETVDYNKFERVLSVSFADYTPGSATPEKMTKGEYVVDFSDTYAAIYKKKKKAPAKKRPQEEIDREKEVKQREAELSELTENAYKLRHDFVLGLSVGKADFPKLMKQACRALIVCKTQYVGYEFAEKYSECLNITVESRIPSETCAQLLNELDKVESSAKPLIAAIYAAYGDDKKTGYWQKSYNTGKFPRHKHNTTLDYIYDFLTTFGYELSDVEKSMRDGTHPLLLVEEQAKEADAAKEASDAS